MANDGTGGIAADQLRAFIERIESLEEEKRGVTANIKEVYDEAKATGFDVKIIRQVVRLRQKDKDDRAEEEELLALYKAAIGME